MLLNRQQSKLFTSAAQMYRNTVIIYRGDILNLQSDKSFSHTTNSVFFSESTKERLYFSNLDLKMRRSNRRMVKRMFCAYCIMCPMVHHIEKYNSEKLFDKNDMTIFNATGK